MIILKIYKLKKILKLNILVDLILKRILNYELVFKKTCKLIT